MDWETEIWKDFLDILNAVYLDENTSDTIVLISEPSGKFICKSFKKDLLVHVLAMSLWKAMWAIEVLIKIKAFMWLLLHGRLPVKDKPIRINLLSVASNISPICSDKTTFAIFSYIVGGLDKFSIR